MKRHFCFCLRIFNNFFNFPFVFRRFFWKKVRKFSAASLAFVNFLVYFVRILIFSIENLKIVLIILIRVLGNRGSKNSTGFFGSPSISPGMRKHLWEFFPLKKFYWTRYWKHWSILGEEGFFQHLPMKNSKNYFKIYLKSHLKSMLIVCIL